MREPRGAGHRQRPVVQFIDLTFKDVFVGFVAINGCGIQRRFGSIPTFWAFDRIVIAIAEGDCLIAQV